MRIDKIYIVHYEPLIERKKYLDNILPKISENFEYVISNKETDNNIKNIINEVYLYDTNVLDRVLPINELSVSLSHLEIYRDIISNNYNLCLILEDDAIIVENFDLVINEILQEDLSSFDFIFLSTCCGIVVEKQNEKHIQPSKFSKCVSGYLVNNKKLKDVLENSTPISTNIDNHLNIIKEPLNLNFGSCEPPIIIQGSETNYKSNLR